MTRLHEDDRLPELPSTKHRDYILTDYEPCCDPSGRLHAASLFRHALRTEGMLDEVWPICAALRTHLGVDETVWGFKYGPGGFSLELYFYNFVDNAPGNPRSVSALCEVLAPFLSFDSQMDEARSYFMCSFELDAAALARKSGGNFRVYIGSGDRNRRQCGFSYRVEGSQLLLENHYWFYAADKDHELSDVVRRVSSSPRSGAKGCWSTLLPTQLRRCVTICYAVKPRSDCLYYSRINSEQLGWFLARHHPGALCALLKEHQEDLAHLRWDVGFDFVAASPRATSLSLEKLGVHGVL